MNQNNDDWLIKWKNELPYNKKRYIMIIGFTILVILVVYLGYARGALNVCNDLGGRLEVKALNIECHPGQYNTQESIDNIGQSLIPIFNATNVPN